MFRTPTWKIDPVLEVAGMLQATEGTSCSAMMSNYKESNFYTIPSVSEMQYAGTLWPEMESTCKSSSLLTGGFPAEVPGQQMHHVTPMPNSSTTGSQLNLDFMDDLLSYNQLTSEGVAPYANIFRVNNALAQNAGEVQLRPTDRRSVSAFSPHSAPAHWKIPDSDGHSAEQPLSPVSTCTGLLNMLTLLSGSCGGTDQGLGGASMSMETWNPSTACSSSASATGAPVGGLSQPFDPSVEQLGRLASRDLHQVVVENATQPSPLLPMSSVDSTPLSLPTPTLQMSNTYFTRMDLVGFLSSQVNRKQVFEQPEAYGAAQHMDMTTNQHSITTTRLAGQATQALPGEHQKTFVRFHPSESKYSGHTDEISNSTEGSTVQLGDNLRLQFDRVSEAASPAGAECTLQPHRVRPFFDGNLTIDNPHSSLPHTERQQNIVQSVPWSSPQAPGNNFPNVALPMDLSLPQATGMTYQTAGPSRSSGKVLSCQRRLQKLAPMVKTQVDHQHGEIQKSPLVAGGQNFFKRTSLHSSPKDVLKAEDHVVRERRRRDVMNTRFQTLESLLPRPICRRDRYGIVEDTMLYVKETEQLLANLKVKAASCKQRLELQMAHRQSRLQQQPPSTSESRMRAKCLPIIQSRETNGVPRAQWAGNMVQDSGKMPQDSKVEVIVPSNQEHIAIVVECRSQSGGRLFSGVLRGIEKLHLEVTQCSVTKCEEFFLCNAACKSQGSIGLSHEQILWQLVTSLRPYLRAKSPSNTSH